MTCDSISEKNQDLSYLNQACGSGSSPGNENKNSAGYPLTQAQILALLESAIAAAEKESDPAAAIAALYSARETSESMYLDLSQLDPATLTDDAKKIISLYEKADCYISDMVDRLKEDAESEFGSLASMIMSVPADDRSEKMREFLKIYLQIMKTSRDAATTLSATYFSRQVENLNAVAKAIKAEGEKLFQAGMTQGGMAMAIGVAQTGFAVVSAGYQIKSSNAAANAERAAASAKNEACPITAKNLIDESARHAGVAASHVKAVNNYTTAGKLSESTVSVVSTFTSSSLAYDAKTKESERVEHQTSATIAEQGNALSKESLEKVKKDSDTFLDLYRATQQSESDQLIAVSRA